MAIQRYNPGYVPPATLALVIAIGAISLVDMFNDGYLERLFWARGIDVQYGDYWRLLTCGWVHVDLMHLAFNSFGIFVLSSNLERLHGYRPVLLIYVAGQLGGAGLAMAFTDPAIAVLGASAGSYGLFGAALGYYYSKTGTIRGLWEIPYARTLLIWLAFGAYLSFRPGISLFGHLGGFVPGVVLGVFFEHRYARQLDIYHKLSAGIVALAVVLLLAFSCAPFTRASWYGAQALRAWESGDLKCGDEWLARAKGRNASQDGAAAFMTHLRLWREGDAVDPDEYDTEVLRLALTQAHLIQGGEANGLPFTFLREPTALEAATPPD